MKTILVHDAAKHDYLIKTLTSGQALFGVQLKNPSAWLNPCDNSLALHLNAAQALQQQKNLHYFKEMVQYPAFLDEVIHFYQECLLYQIELSDLPHQDGQQQEMLSLLQTLTAFDFPKPNFNPDFADVERIEDGAENCYEDRIFKKFNGITHSIASPQQPKIELHTALNVHQEIEAIAQKICREEIQAEDVLIVACDNGNDQALFRQIFDLYHIPFTNLFERTPSRIVKKMSSLTAFIQHRDQEHFLSALADDVFSVPCERMIRQFIAQMLASPTEALNATPRFETTVESPLFNPIDLQRLRKSEQETLSYLESIHEELALCLSEEANATPFETAYQLLMNSPLLNNPQEKKAFAKIKTVLETGLPLHVSESLLMHQIEKITCDAEKTGQGVLITDLRHPVMYRPICIVQNCHQKNYPAFKARTGFFDEDYVRDTPYPSYTERDELHNRNLKWIERAASQTLIYSYPVGNVAGKSFEASFEIEQATQLKPTPWPLLRREANLTELHTLNPALAEQLFVKQGKIHGSVSRFEKYFNCPYSYFLHSGMKLHKASLVEIGANTLGTLQHAIVEKCAFDTDKRKAEDFYHETDPYFAELKHCFPQQSQLLDLLQERMVQSLLLSFEFLDTYHQATDFQLAETEMKIEAELLDDEPKLQLQGFIDRVDTYHRNLRIIDYKSSEKNLQKSHFEAGVQLQLLTYMTILADQLGLQAQGTYYLNLGHGDIASLCEDVDEWLRKKKLTGWTYQEITANEKTVLPSKVQDFEEIRNKLTEIYRRLRDQLLSGDIRVEPTEDACTYCDYKPICRFRGLKKKPTSLFSEEDAA